MHIAFVEIANFRKLLATRIDFNEKTTIFVGANNSGKTSAMLTLRYFLSKRGGFTINDFTLCHRQKIIDIGGGWLKNAMLAAPEAPVLSDWDKILPSIDVWLNAKDSDLHYVSHILPTLDWAGGFLGVRLRLEPKDIEALYREFVETTQSAHAAKAGAKAAAGGNEVDIALWPRDLPDFLRQRLGSHFQTTAYILDPDKLSTPDQGIATPQSLTATAVPLEGDPFAGLIQVNEIPAQRDFGDTKESASTAESATLGRNDTRKLASQFREYFSKHLNPTDTPDAADILALKAIDDAQKSFDVRLKSSFAGPLKEMEDLGYPGVTDPRVTISTLLRHTDGLDHESAVQYEVAALKGAAAALLPENYNGLGYQNLISMVFRLMSFRDAWMRVGKAKNSEENAESGTYPPLHLVLVEEPEAHLHAQVQQVFIRKAYAVLRKHDLLGAHEQFSTQLIVSSHSSHVAHEVEFECLRYFRRLPAGAAGPSGEIATVPISTVINLTDAFGDETETTRFARRYLRATHCDLFFADAAIFVEGAAERMLLPHFVRNEFHYLNQCYITWLEVGGSHAHRLRPLIERLGLLTLVVTDLDAGDPTQNRSASRPLQGKGLVTNNSTLKKWLPKESAIDILLGLAACKKIAEEGSLFAVRVAYQIPVAVEIGSQKAAVTPYTLEDAIVLENLDVIGKMIGSGLTGTFAKLVISEKNIDGLAERLFDVLDSGKKAEFALDLLELKDGPETLRCPVYISEGLRWLEDRLRVNRAEILAPAVKVAEVIGEVLSSVSVGENKAPVVPTDTSASEVGSAPQ
jgi:predicted ATP-dependent endonuclease of OLD family